MNAKLTPLILVGLLAGILPLRAQQTTNAAPIEAPAPEAKSDTNEVVTGAVIRDITMDDVLLTDAIKNFARQAGINIMLDPHIPYGQPGPDGKPMPQPSVSIRWENVTAEQALYALLSNYNLQLVEDPKTHIGRITVKDPAAPDPLITKVVQLQYASPSNVLSSVQSVLLDKRSKVVADSRTSQVVVLATEKELHDVDSLIARLDTQTRQVLIEARLLETSINPSTAKGIDWSGTLAAQNISFGNGSINSAASQTITQIPGAAASVTLPGGRTITTTPSSSSQTTITANQGNGGLSVSTLNGFMPSVGFLNADGVHAVLSFLNEYSDAKVLSEPRTVTLDNEQATLEVTRATPVINVTAGTANTTGGSQITYTNLGVILHVTPHISANAFINLHVIPEVSRKFDTITKTIQGAIFQADEYDIRKLETHVMVPSGHTLVLGGLMQDDTSTSNTKVPGLGDVPLIGRAFRSDTKSRQKDNLLVFITPTIVNDDDYQVSKSDFLKTPPVHDTEPDWSAWDSGKPYDWHKKPAKTADAGPTYNDNLVTSGSSTNVALQP